MTCTVEEAFGNALQYAFVGLNEEMDLTLRGLAVAAPFFFRNATDDASSTDRHSTVKVNALTGTYMHGAVSDGAKSLLRRHWSGWDLEHKFYEKIKKLFWCKVSKFKLLDG